MAKPAKILTNAQIDEFVVALRATVAAAETGIRLREMVASFSDGTTPVPASPKPTARKAAPTRRAQRTRRPGLDTGKVLAVLVAAKDGMALGDIASKLGEGGKDRVGAALRKLRAQKKATVKGNRQKARWFAA